MNKKEIIRKHVLDMLKESEKAMIKKLEIVLTSGCIDIDNYDSKQNGMLLPKAIISALFESEINQYNGKGTSFERKQKKEIKNIRYYI